MTISQLQPPTSCFYIRAILRKSSQIITVFTHSIARGGTCYRDLSSTIATNDRCVGVVVGSRDAGGAASGAEGSEGGLWFSSLQSITSEGTTESGYVYDTILLERERGRGLGDTDLATHLGHWSHGSPSGDSSYLAQSGSAREARSWGTLVIDHVDLCVIKVIWRRVGFLYVSFLGF